MHLVKLLWCWLRHRKLLERCRRLDHDLKQTRVGSNACRKSGPTLAEGLEGVRALQEPVGACALTSPHLTRFACRSKLAKLKSVLNFPYPHALSTTKDVH